MGNKQDLEGGDGQSNKEEALPADIPEDVTNQLIQQMRNENQQPDFSGDAPENDPNFEEKVKTENATTNNVPAPNFNANPTENQWSAVNNNNQAQNQNHEWQPNNNWSANQNNNNNQNGGWQQAQNAGAW